MKTRYLSGFQHALGAVCALVCAAVYVAAAVPARAQSVITFQGTLTHSGCTPSIQNGGQIITLPTIDAGDIPNVGDVSTATPFTVSLGGCGAQPGVTAKIYFYSSFVTDGRLDKSGGGDGEGWQYQLLPANSDTQLDVGTSILPSQDAAHDDGGDLSTGLVDIGYRVRYYRSAVSVTPGSMQAQASMVVYFP